MKQFRNLLLASALAFAPMAQGAGHTNIQTTNYSINPDNDDDATVLMMAGPLKVTFPPPDRFREGFTVTVKNGDSTCAQGFRGKTIVGAPSGFVGPQGVLWPEGVATAQVVNGQWVTIKGAGRWRICPGSLNPYINYFNTNIYTNYNNVNGDSPGNDGLDPSYAFRTANHALYVACSEVEFPSTDRMQARWVVNMSPTAVDTNSVHWACIPPGSAGGAAVILQNGILNTNGTDGVGAFANAVLQVNNMKISSSVASAARAAYGGLLFLNNVTFGPTLLAHMQVSDNGSIYIQGDYSVEGGASYHTLAQTNGTISIIKGSNPSITVNINADIAVPGAWAFVERGALLSVPYITWNYNGHTVTGRRLMQSVGGVVYSGTGTACSPSSTYFPGSTPVSSDGTGGCY